MIAAQTHSPPLHFAVLTPLYDRVVAALTRENIWRRRLVDHIGARRGETILDVGSGTGSLAMAITAAAPGCIYRGIDPDAAAVAIAREQAARSGSGATFELGGLAERAAGEETVNTIVCSLVLHQVPVAEKDRLLRVMFARLKPGGRLFVADYARQPTVAMRMAFRATVQLLDGRRDTQPNADGILPLLITGAGFTALDEIEGIDTPTGRITIFRAERPGTGRVTE